MPELSVIVPFVNEYPQNIFTLQSIAQELRGRVDFEVLAIDNHVPLVDEQKIRARGGEALRATDGPCEAIVAAARGNPWLKYIRFEDKLSHWQAKNRGVAAASGDLLWFCDAHCIVGRDALYNMVQTYRARGRELHGTLHLPVTYKILEWRQLIYKLVADLSVGQLEYRFTPYRPAAEPYRVPCMSTCGMLMSREIYEAVGGWPEELGIYSGGEHFMNFVLATMGYHVHIMPGPPLYHHGEKRGYHWYGDDALRNRCIAMYMVGGRALAGRFMEHAKGARQVRDAILTDVLDRCREHREFIRARQVVGIDDWVAQWQ